MSKTSTPSVTVTVRDPKGLKFIEVVSAAYNKAKLTEPEAQRVNRALGLPDLVSQFIAQHRHEVPPILDLVASGIKVAGAKRFVARESFTQENGFYCWDNFKDNFLDKIEEDVTDTTLAIHSLKKASLDSLIRNELGPEREEITLTHFFNLLQKQSKGETGHLLVNGYANIAYIRDKNGNLWAVDAYWYSGDRYWYVNANSVTNPLDWNACRQVVSRDC